MLHLLEASTVSEKLLWSGLGAELWQAPSPKAQDNPSGLRAHAPSPSLFLLPGRGAGVGLPAVVVEGVKLFCLDGYLPPSCWQLSSEYVTLNAFFFRLGF